VYQWGFKNPNSKFYAREPLLSSKNDDHQTRDSGRRDTEQRQRQRKARNCRDSMQDNDSRRRDAGQRRATRGAIVGGIARGPKVGCIDEQKTESDFSFLLSWIFKNE